MSDWYHQLAQQASAGCSLAEALRQSAGPPAGDRASMAAQLERGNSVDQILADAPPWLPPSDRFLLSAAEQSGRWAETCGHLAAHHRFLAEQRRHLLAASAYPVAVLHFAILLLPLSFALSFSEKGSFQFESALYARSLVLALGLFWGGLWILGMAARAAPQLVRRAQRLFPGFRRYAHARSLARFTWALEALLRAGVTMRDAFGGAALICDDPLLTPRLLAVLPVIEAGRPPGPALAQIKGIPPDFAALFETAERTGQLDATLSRLNQKYEEEAQAALRSTTFWYPKLLFLCIALGIGWAVSRAYAQYFDFIESLSR